MKTFTLNDLRAVLRACAGVDEDVDLDGDIALTPFSSLGYDSLALIEIVSRIQHHYGVDLPEDMTLARTPHELVGSVDSLLRAEAA
ncbi:acyl carrier protein [Streptomyces sp. NPDC001889]